jgi:16S rRNA (guanine527-N7)-methyltransferase
MVTNTSSESFEEQLEKACQTLSLEPTKQQLEILLEYLGQLLKWNKTYNLTAIRDPEQALVQHIFDSLAIIEPLNNFFQKRAQDKGAVLDVGSGAGLPGVVIATMMPKVFVTCVDTVEKKMTFVRQVSGVLKLTNLKAIHQRVELMQDESFNVVTSRAFATLEDFATLAGDRAEKNGILLAMKGKIPHDEIETLEQKTKWRVDSVEALNVPQLSAQRCLVWMKQKGTQ